jgi:hypothetical protein
LYGTLIILIIRRLFRKPPVAANNKPTSKNAGILLLVLMGAVAVLGYFSIHAGHDWGDDYALYINQAKTIVTGEYENLIRDNSFTVHNSSILFGPVIYPWGYPLMLGFVYALCGMDLFAMKMVGLLFFVLTIPVIFYLFKNELRPAAVFLIIIIFSFNPKMVEFLDCLTSNLPQIFFVLLTILLFQNILASQSRKSRLIPLIAGVTLYCAYFLRSDSATILPAFFIVLIINGWEQLKTSPLHYARTHWYLALPFCSFLFCYLLTTVLFHQSHLTMTSYADDMYCFSLNSLLTNIRAYIAIPAVFVPGTLKYLVYGATVPFFVIGIMRNWRKNYLYLIYCGSTIIMLIIWPYFEGLRFVFTLIPFYLYFFLTGVTGLSFPWKGERSNAAGIFRLFFIGAAACVLYFTGNEQVPVAWNNVRHVRLTENGRPMLDGMFTDKSREMLSFVSSATNQNDTIIFFKPRSLTLLAHRRSMMISDPVKILLKGNYIIIHKKMGDYGQVTPDNPVFRNTKCLQVCFENQEFVIYKKRPL